MKRKTNRNLKLMAVCTFLLATLLIQPNQLFAQNPFCIFDDVITAQLETEMEGIIIENELLMQQQMEDNPQAIMNNVVYEIPVVFHIIHLGEAQGVGSNIPSSAVDATIQQLNDHYRDVLNVGYDVEMEFCLAQRDETGSNSDGINRVDGSSISSYAAFGINSSNEAAVKALSIWPGGSCVNIWVVHNIQSPAGGQVLGFATFPGTSSNLDGIVMRASITGSTAQSGVITHEMGHFFNLYHTFQGSNGFTSCPANNDCHMDGDMVCDTRAHPYMNQGGNWFPCDESQYTSCDPSFNLPLQVVENHMNYTPNSCRDEFTPEQAMRMRCALMTLRPELMNSLCCVPGCTEAIADFTSSDILVDIGGSITFTNTSTGAQQNEWTVEGNTFNSTDLTYQFDNFGTYDVCLTVTGSGCVNQKCVTIEVSCQGAPSCDVPVDCDNLVKNGDFSLNCMGMNSSNLENGAVCNWNIKYFSPRFCTDVNGSDAMVLADWDEAIVTREPVPLEVGKLYKISFEYYRINRRDEYKDTELAFGFDYNPTTEEIYPFNDFDVIGTIENSDYDQVGFYEDCFGDNDVPFKYFEAKFKYEGGPMPHLFFNYRDFGATVFNQPYSYIQIKNVAIMCCDVVSSCNPAPDFTYDVDCPKEFLGTNAGDGDDYVWTFACDGSIHYGPNVTLDLPVGECEVCLTIFCDLETSQTICKIVNVPEPSEDCFDACTDLTIPLQTCAQTEDETNTFVADFDLVVPDGTTPCDGIGIVSNSAYIDIDLSSLSIIDNPIDPTTDIISIGLEVSVPAGYDLLNEAVAGSLTFCDADGKVICYDLTFTGDECTKCFGDMTVTAECVDDNPLDSISTYEGTITLNLPIDGAPFEVCDPVSSQVGYDQTVNQNGNDVSVDFTITSETIGDLNTTTLLCFLIDGEQYCLNVTIDITPCPPPPVDCVEWPGKVATAKECKVVDGQVSYVVEMENVNLFQSGYRICEGGLFGVIGGGGSVEVTGVTSSAGTRLNFIANITMPCGFDTSINYDLTLYACDRDGNTVCFTFVIKFPDCDAECEDRDGGGDSVGGRSKEDTSLDGKYNTLIYPNPAFDVVTIELDQSYSGLHTVQIIDHLGRVVASDQFEHKIELSTKSFAAGIHFIKIIDQHKEVIKLKKLIVVK